MANKQTVVIGILGTTLDSGRGAGRWEKWRPTVALCQQDNFVVHRLELLYDKKFTILAKEIAADIASISPETAVQIHEMTFAHPWDLEEVYGSLYEFARHYPFDVDREDYLVHITTGTHIAQICLFLLTETRYFPAKLIQTSPRNHQGVKAPGAFEIIDLDLSKYDKLASRFQQEHKEALSFLKSGIPTKSPTFNRLIERIEQVAVRSRDPFLLMGPTGAGKSRLAKRIYELKQSRHQIKGAFVEVNCATLRGENAMSTLFGHVKGSFTGAHRDRPGLLSTANGGLLFLDEIGTLGLDEQAMLLRALEEKSFLPLGADKEAHSDFQLIAGTNCDLQQRVEERTFREDLLARINLWTFDLPGLRERAEDIEPNLQFELDQFAQRMGAQVTFNKEARQWFLRFATSSEAKWTGNFRDLNGAVVRMATLAAGGRISVELVEEEIARLKQAWQGTSQNGEAETLRRLLGQRRWEDLDLFDRIQLHGVIQVCREAKSLSDAGRKLFGSSRSKKTTSNDADRLRKYLARFGLDWQAVT
ncbi:MAG TPA: RNA repair transcriptional activator RtcR [Candidatus Binatia bacterium]|nr:RNA repair transcriptional activator RtcR [Candidatus Binatia bacterium]